MTMIEKSVVTLGNPARQDLLDGVNLLADAVSLTLGPAGNTIAIIANGPYEVTKDGVTVANFVRPECQNQAVGASLVREAAQKTEFIAGDGTTTTTILSRDLVLRGFSEAKKGHNPQEIARGMKVAAEDIGEYLKAEATPVSEDVLFKVATTSANNDKEVGDIVGQAFVNAGTFGAVRVDMNTESKTKLVHSPGVTIPSGTKHLAFQNQADPRPKEPLYFAEETRVLIITGTPKVYTPFIPLFEACRMNGVKTLTIMAYGFDKESTHPDSFFQACVEIRGQMGLELNLVEVPGMDEFQKIYAEDLATMTGSVLVGVPDATKMEQLEGATSNIVAKDRLKILGRIKTIETDAMSTVLTLSSDEDIEEAILKRVERLLQDKEATNSTKTRDFLSERMGALTQGVYTVSVSAPTRSEAMEKKYLVTDAVNSTHNAIKHGVLPGGGTAFVKAYNHLIKNKNKSYKDFSMAKQTGYDLVIKALLAPLTVLIENSGYYEHPLEVVEQVKGLANKGGGWNALTNAFVKNMVDEGVVDPSLVSLEAIKNATSAAITLITTAGVIDITYSNQSLV